MPEPSLSEITNISADPDRSGLVPNIAVNTSDISHTLNQAAQFKAENDWKKYNLFLGNLKEAYKNLGDISEMEIATQDREALRKQAGEVFEDIAKNPKAFWGGGAKMGEIQAKIANLRSLGTESKLNRAYDMAHRDYINRNPELNTDENKKLVGDYLNQPLGKRKAYMLNMPTVFDYTTYTKGILENPLVKRQGMDIEFSPDNKFIQELNKTTYNRDSFLKAWNAGFYTQQDKFGHSIQSWAKQRFKELPEEQQKQIGSPEEYWKQLGENAFGSGKDIEQVTKGRLIPNQFELQKMKEKAAYALESFRNNDRIGLEYLKKNLDNSAPIQQTKFLLSTTAGLLNNTTGEKLTVDLGKGKYSEEDVLNFSAPMKGLFGKKVRTTTKEGLTTETSTEEYPDVVTRTKDGGIRTIFYDHDMLGNVVMKDGKPVMNSSEVVSPRETMSIMGKEFMDKKHIPSALDQADQLLKQSFKGNILNYADSDKEEMQQQGELSKDAKDWKKEGKNWRYKDGTLYDDKGNKVKQ